MTESRVQQLPRKFEVKTLGSQIGKDLPDVLTIAEVANFLRIGKSSAYELAQHNDFPSVRIGKRWVVPKPKLLEWMDQQVKV